MKKENLQRYRALFETFAHLAAIIIATLVLSYILALILAPHGLPITEGANRNDYYPIGGLGAVIILLVMFYPPIQIPVAILLMLGIISAVLLAHLGPKPKKAKSRHKFEKIKYIASKHHILLSKITRFSILIGI